MLKDQENMPRAIVTAHDTTLINSVAKVFPTSYALLCRYRITKNVISRLNPVVKTKQIKGEDGIIVKVYVILESIMDSWNVIIIPLRKSYMLNMSYILGHCMRNIQNIS